ncbi:MAG: hypothetical protein V1907_04260 [Candidatus Kerfeldbacteria bacterium]
MKHTTHIGKVVWVCVLTLSIPLFVYFLYGNVRDKYQTVDRSIEQQVGATESGIGTR